MWKILGLIIFLILTGVFVYYAINDPKIAAFGVIYWVVRGIYDKISEWYKKRKLKNGPIDFEYNAAKKILHDPDFKIEEVLEDAIASHLKHGDLGSLLANPVIMRYAKSKIALK
jgi:hypothetical protein